jgi:hypothetical protein
MKHRKCDTEKHRRRMQKQLAKKREQKAQRRRSRRLEERRLRHIGNVPQYITRDFLKKVEVRRLISLLGQRMTVLPVEPDQASPEEAKQMIAEAEKPTAVICPLCKLPITVDDVVTRNVNTIIYNGEKVQVHKICPAETKTQIVCGWCGKPMGEKDGKGETPVTTSICDDCKAKVEAGTWEECPFRTHPVIKYLGSPTTPELISCPTCGRTHLRDEQTGDTAPFIEWCNRVDEAIQKIRRPIKVAVMGCEVNGPGEARQADVGIAIGKTKAALFKHGEVIRTVPLASAIDELLQEIERTW